MSSKRQQIVNAVIARMQLIKIADGYQTDLGDSVHDFETNFQEDELPAISVCDLIADHELANNEPTATVQTDKIPIQIRIFANSDARAAFLRMAIADIWKAIKTDPRWNGLALHTLPRRSGLVLSDEAFQIGGAAVEIEVHIFNQNFGS